MSKKLYRSNENKVFAGICGGIGEYLDIDPVVIRVVWLFLTIFMGLNIIFYIILIFIIPAKRW